MKRGIHPGADRGDDGSLLELRERGLSCARIAASSS